LVSSGKIEEWDQDEIVVEFVGNERGKCGGGGKCGE
jgi:hypothetical protein